MVSNMNYEDNLNDEGVNAQLELEVNEVYPWRRYFARMIDLSCLGLATTLFFLPYIPVPLVKMLIDLVVWVMCEAIIMGLFGTTIGKFILNIKVMDSCGNKITYDIAFKRSLMVWVYGYGLGIPILSLITLIKSHSDLQEKLKTKWDKKYDLTVIHGSINVIRVVAAILIIVGLPIIPMIIIRLI